MWYLFIECILSVLLLTSQAYLPLSLSYIHVVLLLWQNTRFPKICFISVTLRKFSPWIAFSPVPFFFGSILEWGDTKKGAITSQSKEYGSSTWMVIQLGWCREEVTFVVKISSLLMVQSWGLRVKKELKITLKFWPEKFCEKWCHILKYWRMEENMTWKGKPSVHF